MARRSSKIAATTQIGAVFYLERSQGENEMGFPESKAEAALRLNAQVDNFFKYGHAEGEQYLLAHPEAQPVAQENLRKFGGVALDIPAPDAA